MTSLVDGRQSHFVTTMWISDVPNWFSSQTLGMIGVFVTLKQSRCVTGLTILVVPVGVIFSVGRHNSCGVTDTLTSTALGANSSCRKTAGGGLKPTVPATAVTG